MATMEERMKILGMVQEGKLTPEEAAELLEALSTASGPQPQGRARPGGAGAAAGRPNRSGRAGRAGGARRAGMPGVPGRQSALAARARHRQQYRASDA